MQKIVNIDVARLQIGVIQLTILQAETAQYLLPGIFRGTVFTTQQGAGGIKQFWIVQQHMVTGENGRQVPWTVIFHAGNQRHQIEQREIQRVTQSCLLCARTEVRRLSNRRQRWCVTECVARDVLRRRCGNCRIFQRFAEILRRQTTKRGQRIIRLLSTCQQTYRVMTANLQQRNLIKAVRRDALAVFFQQQIGVKGRQCSHKPGRRTHVQTVGVFDHHGDRFC